MSVRSATRYAIEALTQRLTDLPICWEPPFAIVRITAYRWLGARLSRRAVIQQRVRIRCFRNLVVHHNSFLGFDVRVHAEALVTICENTIIGPGAAIFTGDHSSTNLAPRALPVTIGPRCLVGVRALILGGVAIGADVIVGAGAVVTGDIPPRAIAVGAPARVIGYRDAIEAGTWTINGVMQRDEPLAGDAG